MTITEHSNIQMTSALAAVTAPAPPTKRKMYAHQLVNELEESEYRFPLHTHPVTQLVRQLDWGYHP